jgi:hypothetical protein
MPAPETLLYPTLALIPIYLVSTILMLKYLQQKGEKINWLWIRLFLFKYVSRYRELTVRETGSPGGLFYTWIASISLALICVILMLIGSIQCG